MVSLGFDADGKRVRKKVTGKTRTEVKNKLKALHSELDAGVGSAAGYTVEKAVADWLDEGLPGRNCQDSRSESGLAAAAASPSFLAKLILRMFPQVRICGWRLIAYDLTARCPLCQVEGLV